MRVDLPAPDGPRIAVSSPARNLPLTALRIVRRPRKHKRLHSHAISKYHKGALWNEQPPQTSCILTSNALQLGDLSSDTPTKRRASRRHTRHTKRRDTCRPHKIYLIQKGLFSSQ